MRVIAGTARGVPLKSPRSNAIRPTLDQVREAIFNILAQHVAIEDASVLDLFAGTGAMGIEALSRGAAHAMFIDNATDALRIIHDNLEKTKFAERAEVHRGDALRWIKRAPKANRFDLVFIDPPYRGSELLELLSGSDLKAILAPNALIVAETGRLQRDSLTHAIEQWRILTERTYGDTIVLLLQSL